MRWQRQLSQLQNYVDHPYLSDGNPVPFPVLFFVNNSVVKIIENLFKRIACIYSVYYSHSSSSSFFFFFFSLSLCLSLFQGLKLAGENSYSSHASVL
jgi:hypothetical protein